MRRHFLVFCLLLSLGFSVSGKGYKITVHLAAAKERQVFLTHYYGASVFIDDTVMTDISGTGIFQRDTLLPPGLYKIYLDQHNHFDFLLGEDQTLVISNPSFNMDNLTISGAEESEEFLAYMQWLRQRQGELALLDSALKVAAEEDKAPIRNQISDLNKNVNSYWKEKSARYPGTLLSAFLMSNYYEELNPEDIPEEYSVNDSLKWTYEYNYRKNHFFDYFDLSDERLLYTPLVKSKLDTYFERILLQMYDSVKPAIYQVISTARENPKTFRYVTSYFLNASLTSKVMGMDALFVDLARDFYLSGKTAWADSATLAKIRENVIFLEHNLIGQHARDIVMETLDGQPFRLYQQKSKYTILVFFEPDCSHCNEFIPRLYKEIYLPFREKGLEVVAGYSMDNKDDWIEFVEKYQIYDWINVWDEHHLSRFKIIYDTRTTPSVYLLDENKKIIAKRVSIDFFKNYLTSYLGDPTPGKE
ncbi:MAG TPA: redoxin domain-containing protein [Prolixibacteraceae bacterium]|nr:redoxin domain-containing protein [Prolixibacteraceae bacterium]HPL44458.1 redoxin domain-containing protein [Prolixibacteraceae bacterium]